MTPPTGDAPNPRTPPRKFGEYELVQMIGRSGGAVVYRARQTKLDRLVTLTILPRKEAEKPAFATRFQRQVAAASKLRHPNILSAIDAGAIAGNQFIVSEHVSGRRVAAALEAGEWFGIRRCLRIATDMAMALEHLEGVGFVHRNITPRSILVGDNGTTKLRGFSMAREQRPTGGETWFDRDAYSQQYKSPDFMTHDLVDIRADIYSVGCVLFHMLTGQPPFPGSNAPVVVERHATQPVPDVKKLRADVPDGLVTVLARMLAKEREERYQHPSELVQDLEKVRDAKPVEPPPAPKKGLFRRRRKRR